MVIDVKEITIVECPVCKSHKFVVDFKRKEVYCVRCGLIIPVEVIIKALMR